MLFFGTFPLGLYGAFDLMHTMCLLCLRFLALIPNFLLGQHELLRYMLLKIHDDVIKHNLMIVTPEICTCMYLCVCICTMLQRRKVDMKAVLVK